MGLCLTDLCEVVAIYLPWVAEDTFSLLTLMVREDAASTRREAPRGALSNRKYGLFILGILRTDLYSQGTIYYVLNM